MNDPRIDTLTAEVRRLRAELLAILHITKCVAECSSIEPGDTVTVHGVKCMAQLINKSAANDDELIDLLATMFDAYEEGPDCYEDPDDCSGHLGKAVQLDDVSFNRISAILNERRPRKSIRQ